MTYPENEKITLHLKIMNKSVFVELAIAAVTITLVTLASNHRNLFVTTNTYS